MRVASAPEEDPALSRRRARLTAVKVFAVQIVTLTGLWLLNVAFGTP